LNVERLKGFVAEAVAITKALEPDEFRKITPEELFQDRPDVDLDLVDPAVAEITREQRLAWCEALDTVARDNEKVISATAGVYDGSSLSASVGRVFMWAIHTSPVCRTRQALRALHSSGFCRD